MDCPCKAFLAAAATASLADADAVEEFTAEVAGAMVAPPESVFVPFAAATVASAEHGLEFDVAPGGGIPLSMDSTVLSSILT